MSIKESIKKFVQKIPAFFSGFMLGVIITGAFFIFKINEYIMQIKQNIYPKITVIEKTEKSEVPGSKPKKPPQKNNTKNYADTSVSDIISGSENNNDNAFVIEEKIVSEKTLQIIHLDAPTDTALANLSEVPPYLQNNEIKIIFKKNPFNNKGYYYENNHLVLYGLEDIPYINVYEYKNDLYVKYDKMVFKLPFTTRFQTFIKVEDEMLLAKMN
ncbi:MAG: hypothetical protein D6799_08040 [Bacteroidetes bacterium]|jgi:hypothetical protein|nr:MAG: hypothetical protein D6799_08040 [Bacteroidota bacterium]